MLSSAIEQDLCPNIELQIEAIPLPLDLSHGFTFLFPSFLQISIFILGILLGFFAVMGRKLFFAQKDEITEERCQKLLDQSGYVFGAHADKDSIREKDKRINPRPRRCTAKLLIFGWSELRAIVHEE
jgi:hypothetical protein